MHTQPAAMTTVTSVLEKLRKKGWDKEFIMDENGFTPGDDQYYSPEELLIVKTYRFEGPSDPADSAVIYIIQTKDGLTGYSMDSYGAQSNHGVEYDEFLRKIPVEEREEQAIFS